VSFAGAVNTPANRFAQLGTSVADGHAPALGAVVVLTAWLIAFGSYAVLAYRRTGRTV
jgi:ABC-2 type transport system permease protein